MRVTSSAITSGQPWGHSRGVPMCQFAETSSGGMRDYGIGMRQARQAAGRSLRNSASSIV